MKYSVVIVAYNSEKVILKCLNSLLDSIFISKLSIEIILVDNDAKGGWGSLNLIKSKINSPNIKLIKSKANLGFSYGCNLGAKSALGKWVLFLNPDAFVKERFFNDLSEDLKHLQAMVNKSYPLVIGFHMIGSDGLPNRNGGVLPEMFSFKSNSKKLIFKPGYLLKVQNHSSDGLIWPLGAAMMVSRKNFVGIGGFDERLFLTLEEPSFMNMLNRYILFFSRATVLHDGGHSYKNSLDEYKFFYQSLILYRENFEFSYIKDLKLLITLLRLKIKILFMESFNNH
jgi:N-acetylglucosaminyl-diphospho-decaprenol L-rhamnosyltransferase